MVYVEDLTGCGSIKRHMFKLGNQPEQASEELGLLETRATRHFRTVAINPFGIDVLTYVSKKY